MPFATTGVDCAFPFLTVFDVARGSAAPNPKIIARKMNSAPREFIAPACLTRWRRIFMFGVPVSGNAARQSGFVGFVRLRQYFFRRKFTTFDSAKLPPQKSTAAEARRLA